MMMMMMMVMMMMAMRVMMVMMMIDDEGNSEAREDEAVECSWQYGFDAGPKAWRVLVGSSSGTNEYAPNSLEPAAGSALAPAAFLGGTVHEIPVLIHSKIGNL